MAFDTKAALAKITDPEKRAKLEAALAEADGFIAEVETLASSLETERTARTVWEKEKTEMTKNWETASKEYEEVFNLWSSTDAEKKEAAKKLDEANKLLLETKAKLAENIKTAPAIDTSKFQTVEDAVKFEAGRTAYFAKVLKVQREHAKLFPDVELDPEKLVQESLAAKKPLEDYWRETFKVDEKRAANAKATADKHDKELEDKGYQRAIAEMRNPSLRTLESSEEPFYTPKDGDKVKNPWDLEKEGIVPADEAALLKELTTIQ